MKRLAGLLLICVPRTLWWACAMMFLAAVNLAARQELWLHTPLARPVCWLLLGAGAVAIVGAGPWVCWRVGEQLPWALARLVAKLAAIVAALVAIPIIILLVVAVIMIWTETFSGL